MTPFDRWTVLPHGPLTVVAPGVLTVTGDLHMPMTEFQRRMTIVRLGSGRLVIFSAIALDEAEMREIESFGRPSFLVVPNDHHRLDARVWKERYPKITVVAPAGAREKVEEVVPVDTSMPVFEDPHVRWLKVAGTHEQEAALLVDAEGEGGATLVLNDLIGNLPPGQGIGGWFLRIMDFAGDSPHIPKPVKLTMVDDNAALRAQLLEWASLDSLERIVVSHGAIIDREPRAVLRELASTLH